MQAIMHNFLCWRASVVVLTLITNILVSASAVGIYAMRQVNCSGDSLNDLPCLTGWSRGVVKKTNFYPTVFHVLNTNSTY